MDNIFKIILLIARPAAGKSEIINYLHNIDDLYRKNNYHLGKIDVIDDFEMLWNWFEEDSILEKMGYPRLHTDKNEYFVGQYLWDLLIEKISLSYLKKIRDVKDYHNKFTTIIEFSRGKEHGGYKSALSHISEEILKRMAIMYVDVSWEESLRKNKLRFNPEKPDSILEHSLSFEKMERLYKDNDWFDLTNNSPNIISVKGIDIPYVIFNNEDDVTSKINNEFENRLKTKFGTLWKLYENK